MRCSIVCNNTVSEEAIKIRRTARFILFTPPPLFSLRTIMAPNPDACTQCWGDLAPQNHVFPASACVFGCVRYDEDWLSSHNLKHSSETNYCHQCFGDFEPSVRPFPASACALGCILASSDAPRCHQCKGGPLEHRAFPAPECLLGCALQKPPAPRTADCLQCRQDSPAVDPFPATDCLRSCVWRVRQIDDCLQCLGDGQLADTPFPSSACAIRCLVPSVPISKPTISSASIHPSTVPSAPILPPADERPPHSDFTQTTTNDSTEATTELPSTIDFYDYKMLIPLFCTFYCIVHVLFTLWKRIMPEPRPSSYQHPPLRSEFPDLDDFSESDSDGVLTPPETPRLSVYDTVSLEPAAIRARRDGRK